MILDAASLAKAWLAVYTASGKETLQPALCRTIHIEQHAHGVRLTATDSYMILTSWVPEVDYELDPEPGLDEVPYASATAIDSYGRGVGLLAHLLRLARADDNDEKELHVVLRLNVAWEPSEKTNEIPLEGLEALAVNLEHPNRERVQLEVYEGSYPSWQAILLRQKTVRTEALSLSAWMAGRLSKAAKVYGEQAPVRCWFGGQDKPIQVRFGEDPAVTGLVMPLKWDFEKDAPYGETDSEAEG